MRRETNRRSAISALRRPSATSARTSSSRVVSSASFARVVGRGPRGRSRTPNSRSSRATIAASGPAPRRRHSACALSQRLDVAGLRQRERRLVGEALPRPLVAASCHRPESASAYGPDPSLQARRRRGPRAVSRSGGARPRPGRPARRGRRAPLRSRCPRRPSRARAMRPPHGQPRDPRGRTPPPAGLRPRRHLRARLGRPDRPAARARVRGRTAPRGAPRATLAGRRSPRGACRAASSQRPRSRAQRAATAWTLMRHRSCVCSVQYSIASSMYRSTRSWRFHRMEP